MHSMNERRPMMHWKQYKQLYSTLPVYLFATPLYSAYVYQKTELLWHAEFIGYDGAVRRWVSKDRERAFQWAKQQAEIEDWRLLRSQPGTPSRSRAEPVLA